MKILVITDLYPVKAEEKHTPRTIYDFVQGWKTLGHEVRVIKPNFVLNSLLREKPYYKNGIYGEVINANYFTPFLGKVDNKIKRIIFDENLIAEADIVIAHMPCGVIFANKLGTPFTAGVHVSDLEVLTNPIYSIYFKQQMENAYKNAHKIACRSEVLKKKFLKLFPQYEEKTFVAYSGINSEIIIERKWSKKEQYKIFTCGRLIKRKNIDKVIRACEKFENISLTVAGDGREIDNLKKLSSKVKFLGHIKHSQVLEEMRKSDIFILPSKNETFGMVYLEAMASGCVTVGLKNDGIDGILQDGINGFLCNSDNIDSMLERIINSDNTEILKNSYSTILNYTTEKACLNYLENL